MLSQNFRTMNATVDDVQKVTSAEGFDCHFEKSGQVALARSQAQLLRARKMLTSTADFGVAEQTTFQTPSEAKEKVPATDVMGGLYTGHCAVLQPELLGRGLVEAVTARGGRLFEKTPALDIKPDRVVTSRGTVRADVIIRATNYSQSLPSYRRVVAPVHSLVVATEPRPAALRDEVADSARVAFGDMRHLRVYGQITRDDRVILGGRGSRYHVGSSVKPTYDSTPVRIVGSRHSLACSQR